MARPEVLAFLDDIKDNLEDDTPRLILADWLDDHDDPRGQLLRVQCRLARMSLEDPLHAGLTRIEQDLLRQHQADWLSSVGGVLGPWRFLRFYRGLVHLSLGAWRREKELESLLAEEAFAWVEQVRLEMDVQGLERTGQLPLLFLTASLDLCRTYGPDMVAPLLNWPALPRLTRLNLAGNRLVGLDLTRLSGQLDLPRLNTLDLSGNQINSFGILRFIQSPLARGLTHLDLTGNKLDSSAVRHLTQFPASGTLRELRLGDNALTADAVRALISSPHLAGLRLLDLSWNQLSDAGVRLLAAAENFERLETLDLSRNWIGRAAIDSLLASPWLPRLRQLRLRYQQIHPDDAGRLHAHFGERVRL